MPSECSTDGRGEDVPYWAMALGDWGPCNGLGHCDLRAVALRGAIRLGVEKVNRADGCWSATRRRTFSCDQLCFVVQRALRHSVQRALPLLVGRDRKFADSLLEGTGFEPSVPLW
jgi:hypothetical protein